MHLSCLIFMCYVRHFVGTVRCEIQTTKMKLFWRSDIYAYKDMHYLLVIVPIKYEKK